MAKPEQRETSFTEDLRKRVAERVADLAVEGSRRASEGPLAAKEIGIAYSTLWRFLYRNKGLSAGATDKVMAWLEGR